MKIPRDKQPVADVECSPNGPDDSVATTRPVVGVVQSRPRTRRALWFSSSSRDQFHAEERAQRATIEARRRKERAERRETRRHHPGLRWYRRADRRPTPSDE